MALSHLSMESFMKVLITQAVMVQKLLVSTCAEENGKESDNRFKYTVAYEVDDDLTLFAVSSVGYRSGGNNAALPFFCANDPEAAGFKRRYTSDEAENTEIGVKSRGDNYTLNATYFWVDWTGIQVTVRPACGWSFHL